MLYAELNVQWPSPCTDTPTDGERKRDRKTAVERWKEEVSQVFCDAGFGHSCWFI